MKTSLTLQVFFLTCAVVYTYARVLPSSSLASAGSSISKSIERDLDPPSQYVAQSCPASPSMNKRVVTLGDGASYDNYSPGNQPIGSTNTLDIQDNPIELALNTPPPAQDTFPVGDNQPFTPKMNPTDNQPINWNYIFDGQNKVDLPMSIPAENMFLGSIPANPMASTKNIAPDNVELNSPGGNSDAIMNSGSVAAGIADYIPEALRYNENTGIPYFDCVLGPPNAYTVWEMIYQGTSVPVKRWPHAILLADGYTSQPPFIRYTVVMNSKQVIQLGKNNNFQFIQKGKVVLLHQLTRKGWLVAPEGEDKSSVLPWFEKKIGIKELPPSTAPHGRTIPVGNRDYNEPVTATWTRYIFDEVLAEPIDYWVPVSDPSTPSVDPSSPQE